MDRWAFRFLLFYIVILCVQPQNRFTFLHPLQIADLSIVGAIGMHFLSHQQAGRSFIRAGPATISAIMLMLFGFISLHTGAMQSSSAWNGDIDIIIKNGLVLILVEAMATTVRRVWAVQATLFFAVLWWIKGGLRLSSAGATYAGDRLMGPTVSLIENPNGFAYLLTLMIPIYLYFYQHSGRKWISWASLACALASVYIVMETGSRTGLVSLLAAGAFLIPKYAARQKLALAVGAVAIYFIMSIVSPGNIERFKTIPQQAKIFFSGGGEDDPIPEDEKDPLSMTQDEQSAWERRMKKKQTWALIQDYPVFGVGVHADDSLVKEKYPYATGQVHNEILYAGKQMGYIGMAIYTSFIVAMFYSGWMAQRRMKKEWPAIADLGWTFKMQAVVVMAGGFFSPLPWNPISMILAGSASALLLNLKSRSF
jgi:hypothetical protein